MLTKNTKHDNCDVYITTHPQAQMHKISLRCKDHNKHIQWLNFEDYTLMVQAGVERVGETPDASWYAYDSITLDEYLTGDF